MNTATSFPNKLLTLTLGKFLTVGVLNTAITIAVIFAAKTWLRLEDVAANACGYVIGMLCSFLLNKHWTFSHKGQTLQAFCRFLAVCGVAYLANLAALKGFLNLGLNPYLCHILAMPFYTVVFFIGSKAVVFVKYKDSEEGRAPFAPVFVADVRAAGQQEQYATLFVLAFIAAATVFFYRLAGAPIELWDESRLANNAIEMARNGLSLITTFDWAPDHWNTKPPLLIWLMASTMKVVGMNELGVRLPSAVASLATAMLVYWFVGHCFRRPVLAFVAVLVMLASPGYILFHGARSGDYDALLTLLTTIYILFAFAFLEGDARHKRSFFLITTVAIVLAFYTKAIQGMIFLPALFIYALVTRQIGMVLSKRYFYVCCVLAAVACISYYWFRNEIDPGYFAAVQANDLGGRYSVSLEGHRGGPLWYVEQYPSFPWLIPGILMAAYLALRGSREVRRLALYLGIVSVFYLAILSSASTKIVWYATPLVPLSAILCALGVGDIAGKLNAARPAGWKLSPVVLLGIAGAAPVVVINMLAINQRIALKEASPYEQQSLALRSLIDSGERHDELLVLHRGYPTGPRGSFYVAPAMFYATALSAKGTPTRVVQEVPAQAAQTTLLVCNGEVTLAGSAHQSVLGKDARCALHTLAPHTAMLPNGMQPHPADKPQQH
ncbi:GtrA family protein [Pseudoduganella chitinolytica]|uniref:GtrA family protein n=1 Tax=Pseudoduganella chitinolytica TaxID=34070 RepID=A0ABY8BMS4_9BURK|nr:GtrA family protein [Pseudoduganella chitinolytica]WEF35659.1 GtrA family protein [Pseudoduganella chitinolytica]